MWRVARFAASSVRSSSQRRFFSAAAIPGACIVHKRGADILHDPWFNKVNISLFLFVMVFSRWLFCYSVPP